MTDTPKYDDGGQAYPDPAPTEDGHQGMTLADHIACNAVESEFACIMPNTTMGCTEKCRQLGFIGEGDGYTPEAYIRLDAWGRYQYAASMIAEKRRREGAPIDYARSVTMPDDSTVATPAEIQRRNGN